MFLNKIYSKSLFSLYVGRYNRIYKYDCTLCEKSLKEREKIKKFSNIEYMSRELASLNIDIDEELIQYLLYIKNTDLDQYLKIVKKIENKKTNSGIIDKDGFIEKDSLHILKKKVKNLDDTQNYYKLILVFNSDILMQSRIYNYKNINRVIESFLPIYFETQKLDKQKIYWFYSIHTNSNSFHIHLYYFENQKSDCLFGYKKSGMEIKFLQKPITGNQTFNYMRTKIKNELLLIKKEYQEMELVDSIYKGKTILKQIDNNYNNYSWYDLRQIYTDIKFNRNNCAKHAFNFINEMKDNNLDYDTKLNEIKKNQLDNFNMFVDTVIKNVKLPKTESDLLKQEEELNYNSDSFKDTKEYKNIRDYIFNKLMAEYKKHELINESKIKSLWTYLTIKVKPVYNKIFFINIRKIESAVESIILKYYFNNNIKLFSKIILNDFNIESTEIEKGEHYEKQMK